MNEKKTFRAYVIYGGQFVYGRSSWHESYTDALNEGRATCKPAERDFIGVVCDAPDGSPFHAALLRGLTMTGQVVPNA